MTAPADVYERVARTIERAGWPLVSPVSSCATERGARRVAARYEYAEIRRNGDRWEVWTLRDGV